MIKKGILYAIFSIVILLFLGMPLRGYSETGNKGQKTEIIVFANLESSFDAYTGFMIPFLFLDLISAGESINSFSASYSA